MYITYIKKSTYDNIHAYFSIIRQVNYYELSFTNIGTYLLCDIWTYILIIFEVDCFATYYYYYTYKSHHIIELLHVYNYTF